MAICDLKTKYYKGNFINPIECSFDRFVSYLIEHQIKKIRVYNYHHEIQTRINGKIKVYRVYMLGAISDDLKELLFHIQPNPTIKYLAKKYPNKIIEIGDECLFTLVPNLTNKNKNEIQCNVIHLFDITPKGDSVV